MKDYLKYFSVIVVAITIAYICITVKDCGAVEDSSGRVIIPADSGFLPSIHHNYRPKSTPFEKPIKPVSRLPKGIKESDVKRVISVRKPKLNDTTVIIETRDDGIFIPRQDSIEAQVSVTDYLPQILSFGIYPAIGLTLDVQMQFSPSVSICFLKIEGKILAPVFAADIRSVGIGIGYQFYHEISVSAISMWNYSDLQRTIKLEVSYQL
jgi:hypothetical protein